MSKEKLQFESDAVVKFFETGNVLVRVYKTSPQWQFGYSDEDIAGAIEEGEAEVLFPGRRGVEFGHYAVVRINSESTNELSGFGELYGDGGAFLVRGEDLAWHFLSNGITLTDGEFWNAIGAGASIVFEGAEEL